MFCLVLVRPSLAPWMPWSWALLTSHSSRVPFSSPFPPSGELTQSQGRKLHSCSLHILSNLLSKHRSTECAPWGTGFWNSKAEHPLFSALFGSLLPWGSEHRRPKRLHGKGGAESKEDALGPASSDLCFRNSTQLVLRMQVLSLVEWNWWGHRKKWEWCLEGRSWLYSQSLERGGATCHAGPWGKHQGSQEA